MTRIGEGLNSCEGKGGGGRSGLREEEVGVVYERDHLDGNEGR